MPGFINLDFADVTTIMKNAGYAHMGVGSAKGADKAQVAAMEAISSPLLETSITGATGVLVSITASEDIQLDEIDAASHMIYEEAHPDANIIWGAAFDPSLQDEMRVTIIATGFVADAQSNEKRLAESAPAAKPESGYTPTTPIAEELPSNEVNKEYDAPVTNSAEDVFAFAEAVPVTPIKRTVIEATPASTNPSTTPSAAYDASYGEIFKAIKKKNIH